MPTLQKLADNGLMYSQWHTTALCSPTRSTFLTGRNHHLNGCSCITEGADGFPGANGHIPASCATLARCCRTTAGARSGSARTTTCRSSSSPSARPKTLLAAAEGLGPLLRLPRRRDQPVVPGPDVRQPQVIDQPYQPGGGLSPLQGSGRPGDPDAQGRAADQPVAAVVHVVLPRGQPRAASGGRRNGPTSTRASSTTATRPIASGCCRA